MRNIIFVIIELTGANFFYPRLIFFRTNLPTLAGPSPPADRFAFIRGVVIVLSIFAVWLFVCTDLACNFIIRKFIYESTSVVGQIIQHVRRFVAMIGAEEKNWKAGHGKYP